MQEDLWPREQASSASPKRRPRRKRAPQPGRDDARALLLELRLVLDRVSPKSAKRMLEHAIDLLE
jgi:hypothetical protein